MVLEWVEAGKRGKFGKVVVRSLHVWSVFVADVGVRVDVVIVETWDQLALRLTQI